MCVLLERLAFPFRWQMFKRSFAHVATVSQNIYSTVMGEKNINDWKILPLLQSVHHTIPAEVIVFSRQGFYHNVSKTAFCLRTLCNSR
ncbi:TPA: hypothetical protein N0F65_001143 [Lagenidium giganteum]|uniref:Uncharacterized protein n=1 Tax=Lagenidium giganteum TaxID=4803 RepID=A0AAV2YZ73_9STRA|nr:TPA: hypothetical protein N0F65_001143 [Lagenidium giganteum]